MKEKDRQEKRCSSYLQKQALPYHPARAFPLDSQTARNLTLPHLGHMHIYTHTHIYTRIYTHIHPYVYSTSNRNREKERLTREDASFPAQLTPNLCCSTERCYTIILTNTWQLHKWLMSGVNQEHLTACWQASQRSHPPHVSHQLAYKWISD